jgi:hypothetical protein
MYSLKNETFAMIFQSSMGWGKSTCDPNGTTQGWTCPTLLFTIHLHLQAQHQIRVTIAYDYLHIIYMHAQQD